MNPIQRRAFADVKAERDYQDRLWNTESNKGLKVYVSAHDIGVAKMAAQILSDRGFEIVSRWHTEVPVDGFADPVKSPLDDSGKAARARFNFTDIDKADIYVGVVASETHLTGGKHVEAGYALAKGLCCYLYGARRENLASYDDRFVMIDDLSAVVPF